MTVGKSQSIVRFEENRTYKYVNCHYRGRKIGRIKDLGVGFLFYGSRLQFGARVCSAIDAEVVRLRRLMA